ncbi:MAG: NAD-dependent DNA ligase LigA [Clostridia bacterium]|nr:NAD-dependent DNA ligase LigA [Clostridia bacterium]
MKEMTIFDLIEEDNSGAAGEKEFARMKELVKTLNEAAFAYYVEDREIMSNFEYDKLYDELTALEKSTGTVLPDSPTKSAGAGYRAVSKLTKSTHEYPALSLDKTKDRYSLSGWLGGMDGVLSWKLDGLTVVLTYEHGKLEKAVTRGNGFTGEDVTHNVVHFGGVPRVIGFRGKLIIRGEAVMKYADFAKVNRLLPETEAKYKNPRNLASATVRLLDSREAAGRPVTVCAFDLVYIDDPSAIRGSNSKNAQLEWLEKQGFTVVPHVLVTPLTVLSELENFERALPDNEFPTDGLVLILDDEAYGRSLGSTGKFPRSGIAFKWQDETVESVIRHVEWSASRTGLLNPVAVFDPVEIEGTTVSRASVHNVSIARGLKLGEGSRVSVYKANLIIPQIAETVESTGETYVPEKCPVCGAPTSIRENDGIETLYCDDPDCPAKHVGRFTHFVSRDAINIVGLSEATLETFIDAGFIRRFADLYRLERFRDEIVTLDGFGEKSYENLAAAVEASRNVRFSALLNAVGIPGIGKDMAKQISRYLGENAYDRFTREISEKIDFSVIDGVGAVINDNIYAWSGNEEKYAEFTELAGELNISDDVSAMQAAAADSGIAGKTFVITGGLNGFENRDQLVAFIEARGGKVSGSISSKTDYLINNDVNSGSGKNKKAKELGVPIISEADFMALCGE